MKKKQIIDNTKYMFKHWNLWNKKSFLYCFFIVITTVTNTTMYALISKTIVSSIENLQTVEDFVNSMIMLSCLLIVSLIVNSFCSKKLILAADMARIQFRTKALEKLMTTKYINIESIEGRTQFEKGKDFAFMGRWSGSQDFYQVITELCTCFVGIISYVFLLFYLDYRIVVLLLVTCVVEFVIMRKISKMEIENRAQVVPIYQKIDYLFRTIINTKDLKDIKLYKSEKWFKDIILSLSSKCNSFIKELSHKTITITIIQTLVYVFRELLALLFLSYEVRFKELSISNFVFFFGIVTGFSGWLQTIAQQINNLERACFQCEEYRKFINLSDFSNKQNIKVSSFERIDLKGVSFKYGNQLILKNINLSIKKGEKIAIVGENGAGKTTLIKLLCGLYEPSHGKVLVNNVNSQIINKNEYYKMFSVLFQDHYFLPDSIINNITINTKNSTFEEKSVVDILEKVGLLNKINELPNSYNTKMVPEVNPNAIKLSGGEEQRLLLARCLFKNSPIIILDEPTSALDPIAEDKLYKSYNSLMSEKTILYVSHRISSTRFCDKIIFLKDGEIREFGTYEELMKTKGLYWNMFKMQSHYFVN